MTRSSVVGQNVVSLLCGSDTAFASILSQKPVEKTTSF